MATPAALRTLAVDDEPLALDRLRILCADLPGVELVGIAGDGAAALRLAASLAPDLLLLDIAMPGLSGIDVARRLAAPGNTAAPAIVFTTAYDHFAVAAFDLGAADYLMKPIGRDRLVQAIARVGERRGAKPAPAAAATWLTEFWVPHRGDVVRLRADDVDHIEAERDYMRLHSSGRSYLIHDTISALARRLDPQAFLRIHRSVIVRRDRIVRRGRDGGGAGSVTLANGTLLPVGRTYAAALRDIAAR